MSSPSSREVNSVQERRILLVEDNKVNQKISLRLLEKLGYSASLAENGQEAVDMTAAGRFDLVLMDCQMPVKDGYQASAEIRALERGSGQRVPIVAMTANAMAGDREKCMDFGMDDYLTKPVKIETLREALVRWLPVEATDDTPILTT